MSFKQDVIKEEQIHVDETINDIKETTDYIDTLERYHIRKKDLYNQDFSTRSVSGFAFQISENKINYYNDIFDSPFIGKLKYIKTNGEYGTAYIGRVGVDINGEMIPIHLLPREVSACITELTQTIDKHVKK